MAKEYKIRIIRDPLWGDIDISDPIVKELIDTPIIQRLRRIEMSDFAYFNYPGVSSTRFEHSIGTYHLMRTLHYPNRKISSKGKEYTLSVIAALFHHSIFLPFSYATMPVFKEIIGKDLVENILIKIVAEYIYDELQKISEKYKRVVFSDDKRDFFIDFISRCISKTDPRRPPDLDYPEDKFRDYYLKIYTKIYTIPIGANFLEAVCRDSYLSGIGKNFDYKIVSQDLKVYRGNIPTYIQQNIIALLHNLESLINSLYEDKTNAYCSAFVQKLLYGVHNDLEGACSKEHFMKPVKKFLDEVRHLKNMIASYKEVKNGDRKEVIDNVINKVLEIDDFSLYSSLKEASHLIGSSKSEKLSALELQNINSLERVLKTILYGINVDDFEKYDCNIALRSIDEKKSFLEAFSLKELYSFGRADGNLIILSKINKELKLSNDQYPFYSFYPHHPYFRLQHYFNLFNKFKNWLKKEGLNDVLKVFNTIQERLEEKYCANIWSIVDKKNI